MMCLMDGRKAKGDVTPPMAQSAALTAPRTITVLFNESLLPGLPALSSFIITTPAGPVAPASVVISGLSLVLVTALTFVNSNVTLAYTPPLVNPLMDAVGNQVAAFTGLHVV